MKVLDFGIAKLLELTAGQPQHLTQTGMVMGTPHFMSPEQCLGQNVDHRTDVYALGVVLYRVFTGRLPFEGKSFAEVVAHHLTVVPERPSSIRDLPPALDHLIVQCLEKDPTRRPSSAAEVGQRLREALAVPAFAAVGGTAALTEDNTPAGTRRLAEAPVASAHEGAPAGTRPGFAPGGATSDQAVNPRRSRLVITLVLLGAALGGVAALAAGLRARKEGSAAAPPTAESAPVPATQAAPAESAPVPAAQSAPAPAAEAAATPTPETSAARAAQRASRTKQPARSKAASSNTRAAEGGSRVERQGLVKENPFE
jgi:eukaryotic-like serine/threonine-protein kinase